MIFSLVPRRYIEIKIIDDEEYEKNKNFHLELGPPELLDTGPRHGKEKVGKSGVCVVVVVLVCIM